MVLLTFPPRRTPRGVGGLTGLRPLPPTPKKEKFPCQEKCSRVPSRSLFKNKRNFTMALIMKHWKRGFEENFGIPLKYTCSARFSSILDTFRTDLHPKMTPKGVEKSFRELRELQKRLRETSEPVLEAQVVLRGSLKGGWEPSQPSQICCSVSKNKASDQAVEFP